MAAQRTSISELLNPGITERTRTATNPSSAPVRRDYAKENRRRIREAEEANRRAKEEAEREREAFKMKRFKNVESRVLQQTDSSNTPRQTNFLRAGEKTKTASGGPKPRPTSRQTAASGGTGRVRARGSAGTATTATTTTSGGGEGTYKRRQKTKPRVPKANERAELAPRSNKDFIKTNAIENIQRPATKRDTGADDPRQRGDYGKVPTYLLKRKVEIAQQEAMRQAEEPDPEIPPGMMLMSEEERLETLQILNENKEDVLKQLARMPVIVDTFGLRRRKNELDAKLEELEGAIEIFSREKVFIDLEN